MELYAAAGMEFVRELLGQGKDVFLDMKFYDIGETVKRAVAQVARIGRALPDRARQRAGDARRGRGPRGLATCKLLAVTVLTSFDQTRSGGPRLPLRVLGTGGHARAEGDGGRHRRAGVLAARGRLGARAGGPGRDPGDAGSALGRDAAKGDQKRVATPAEAIRDGANYLVIGRQITRAADPAAELARIVEEIRASLETYPAGA